MQKWQNSNTGRVLLLGAVVLCHVCALFFIGCSALMKPDKKENAFRVKLGEPELNSGPVVGPPEKTPDEPPAPPEPPAPEPPAPEPPTPEPPAPPAPEPPAPAIPPKPAPKEPAVPKIAPKPKPKPVKPKTKPKPKPKPVKPKTKPKTKPTPKPKKKDDGVYHPKNTNNQKIGTGYNRQNNARIPVGSRNAAQKYGNKFDNRPPGGGASESMERYGKNLVRYLKSRWTYPPKSLLGGKMPSVHIELDIAPNGRVLGKRIIKRSGVNAMDQSIERMLDQLEQVPSPPDKKITLEIIMQMSDD